MSETSEPMPDQHSAIPQGVGANQLRYYPNERAELEHQLRSLTNNTKENSSAMDVFTRDGLLVLVQRERDAATKKIAELDQLGNMLEANPLLPSMVKTVAQLLTRNGFRI